jgi:arginine-tRNA-protein transferase
MQFEKVQFSSNHYDLYERYIEARHKDGDMYPATMDQYRNFLLQQTEFSRLFTLRDENQNLVACTVVDMLDDGISAIYTYFDPDFSDLSLGTLVILMLCTYAKQKDLPYLYLGYWIKNSQKMAYKKRFQPLEIFNGEFWRPMSHEG